jgi:hypothetical protein
MQRECMEYSSCRILWYRTSIEGLFRMANPSVSDLPFHSHWWHPAIQHDHAASHARPIAAGVADGH